MGPVSIGVEVQRSTDGDTPSTAYHVTKIEIIIIYYHRVLAYSNIYLSVFEENSIYFRFELSENLQWT